MNSTGCWTLIKNAMPSSLWPLPQRHTLGTLDRGTECLEKKVYYLCTALGPSGTVQLHQQPGGHVFNYLWKHTGPQLLLVVTEDGLTWVWPGSPVSNAEPKNDISFTDEIIWKLKLGGQSVTTTRLQHIAEHIVYCIRNVDVLGIEEWWQMCDQELKGFVSFRSRPPNTLVSSL